jgi:phosphotransferase system  glucose/maltose/N-acetylglucosamine-specific IIC component
MKNWLIEKFLKGYLKDFLDKIPFNGKKTILSLLVVVLAIIEAFVPGSVQGVIQAVIEAILGAGAEDWRNAGVVGLIVGLLHKVLKTAK